MRSSAERDPSPTITVCRRPTLGLLTSHLNRGFHRAALMRLSEAARAAGADLICFDGGVLAPPGWLMQPIPSMIWSVQTL